MTRSHVVLGVNWVFLSALDFANNLLRLGKTRMALHSCFPCITGDRPCVLGITPNCVVTMPKSSTLTCLSGIPMYTVVCKYTVV